VHLLLAQATGLGTKACTLLRILDDRAVEDALPAMSNASAQRRVRRVDERGVVSPDSSTHTSMLTQRLPACGELGPAGAVVAGASELAVAAGRDDSSGNSDSAAAAGAGAAGLGLEAMAGREVTIMLEVRRSGTELASLRGASGASADWAGERDYQSHRSKKGISP
jgi:hypothetical protein